MWDTIQIQCSDPYEIAEALINNEVTLNELKSVSAFAPRASVTEEAVWEACKSKKNFQRYLDIYPDGKHKQDIEELMWQAAVRQNDIAGYIRYQSTYPDGTHIAEVEDKVWEVAKIKGSYDAYLSIFPYGKHSDEVRNQQAFQAKEEEAWSIARTIDTVESYRNYMECYPEGKHYNEAKRSMTVIMEGQKETIITAISRDRNAFALNYLINNGITPNDLTNRVYDSRNQVCNSVLRSWGKEPKNLSMGNTPTFIPKGATEVYFWGVPGSGKTCIMAAILSRAKQMGCFAPRVGPGLAYMNELSHIFISDPNMPAVCLPTRSDVDTTQYLPLTLYEKVPGRKGEQVTKQHELAVVEISGEIFECFSRELEGKPFKSADHEKTYTQLKEYLKSEDNPKYHFFVLDSKPLQDSMQMTYLQNAALFFTANGIFNHTTQGISLIVTKSDVLSPNKNEWVEKATESAENYFGSLVSQLKIIVGDPRQGGLGLSNGSLSVIPMSLGEVFFQNLCLFDPEPATELVNLLIAYSKVAENDNWRRRTRSFFRR